MNNIPVTLLVDNTAPCINFHTISNLFQGTSLEDARMIPCMDTNDIQKQLSNIKNNFYSNTIVVIGKEDLCPLLENALQLRFIPLAHANRINYARLGHLHHVFLLSNENALSSLLPLLIEHHQSLSEATMLSTAHSLKEVLCAKHLSIATAESCTGGLIAKALTDLSGSSQYFSGGICTYSAQAKINALGVPAETISTYGIVSKETALAMARGAQKLFATDIALATTGVAGPGPDEDGNPEGLVWTAIAFNDTATSLCYQASTRSVFIDRNFIRTDCTLFLLATLLDKLQNA